MDCFVTFSELVKSEFPVVGFVVKERCNYIKTFILASSTNVPNVSKLGNNCSKGFGSFFGKVVQTSCVLYITEWNTNSDRSKNTHWIAFVELGRNWHNREARQVVSPIFRRIWQFICQNSWIFSKLVCRAYRILSVVAFSAKKIWVCRAMPS